MDRLRDLIDALRLSRSERNWHLRINPERFRILDIDIQFRTLHEQFQIPEQVRDNEAVHEQLDVLIERHTGLTELGSYNRYKKLSTVYNKEMYNKFLVPVWTSAINEDMSTGYVLYPRLTRLRTVLQELRDARLQSRPYVDEWKKVLRLCMAPIALAVDALHTELPNKRPMYLHHDVCLDNVYMKVRKSTDREGKETVEYDDARLKLTWPSQWSHEFFNHHHHHRELREEGVEYLKRHDWYSFGVYILEVLHVLLDCPFEDYAAVNDFVTHVERLELRNSLRAHIIEYVDIARRCIELHEDNFERVTRHQMPPDVQERLSDIRELNTFTLYFDYPICPWTAELLWMYEDERPIQYTEYEHFYMAGDERKTICQACMLSPTVAAYTMGHRRDETRPTCEDKCLFYCFLCYTNGERLFCTKQHGTTSALLGHSSSFALILYGNAREPDDEPHTFEKDANMIANCFKHRRIYGMPEENVHIRPLYDNSENSTPEALLEDHCNEMRRRVHKTDDTDCTVFMFYSGHGNRKGVETDGDWCPAGTADIVITRETILTHLESIKSYQNSKVKCVEVSFIMDACYPRKDLHERISSDLHTFISPKHELEARASEGQSNITDWLCCLMRSLFYTRCCDANENCTSCIPEEDMGNNRDHKCHGRRSELFKRRDRLTHPCKKIANCIIQERCSFFIDGECLRYHQDHCVEHCRYYTSVRFDADPQSGASSFALAYFNLQGVYLKAHPINEDMTEVEVPFLCQMSCDRVSEEIRRKVGDNTDATLRISLLTNMTDGYSEYELVTDDRLNYIIGSSALFYHVITEPAEVTLTMRRKHDEPVVDKLMLNLDNVDTKQLVSVMHKRRHDDADNDADELRVKRTKIDVEPTVGEGKGIYQLPNLLVYIAHHLWHCRSDKTAQDDLSRALKEGFSRRLVTAGDCKDWRCVESSAKNYWVGKDVKAFDIQQTGDKAISVQWEMDE